MLGPRFKSSAYFAYARGLERGPVLRGAGAIGRIHDLKYFFETASGSFTERIPRTNWFLPIVFNLILFYSSSIFNGILHDPCIFLYILPLPICDFPEAAGLKYFFIGHM